MKKLLSLLLPIFVSGRLLAQIQSTDPVTNFNYRLDGGVPFVVGSVTAVGFSTNVPSIFDCPGGPFSSGFLPCVWPTQVPGTVFGVPFQTGGAVLPAPITTVHQHIGHSTTNVPITNTTAETDILNITIPANTLAAGRQVAFKAYGSAIYNEASTTQVRIYLGGTKIYDTGVGAGMGSPSASTGPIITYGTIAGLGATSQLLNLQTSFTVGGGITTGWGNSSPGGGYRMFMIGGNTAAKDSTTDLILRVTYTLGTVTAATAINIFYSTLDVE